MYILYKTHTTGLPKNLNAPLNKAENWPRMVRLSWVLYDETWNLISEQDCIIQPNGFEITNELEPLVELNKATALKVGKPIENVIDLFLEDYKKSNHSIAYNIMFCRKIVLSEMYRLQLAYPEEIITNKTTNLYEKAWYMFPSNESYVRSRKRNFSLAEIYKLLCDKDLNASLSVLEELKTVAICYQEIQRILMYSKNINDNLSVV